MLRSAARAALDLENSTSLKPYTQALSTTCRSSAVALLELLLAAARARIVAANVLQGVTNRFLMAVVAVRAVHMAMIMIVVVIMIVVAVRAMNMRLLGHCKVTPV
ncbi:hypothetical protein PPUJ20066_48410 [Pseudomonas putida]|nr:hypothetical protein PPUJ20066_48410 [Pseudomonas putida]